MYLSDELYLAYKIGNTEVSTFPFPHIYIKNVFPNSLYLAMQENMPLSENMSAVHEKRPVPPLAYKERFIFTFDDEALNSLNEQQKKFWTAFKNSMLSGNLKNFILSKFSFIINQRFPDTSNIDFHDELLLINDYANFKLGPHTDTPSKVISFLFYLPKDETQENLGTSIYFPKDLSFTCEGGPHYNRKNFEKVITMPFVPNSLFCFVKTNNSFHGVEQVETNEKRCLLLYDIFHTVKTPSEPNKFSF